MAIGYSLRMCAHVDSINPGRSNLVFRSKPIAEAEMSNRLIKQTRQNVVCVQIKARLNEVTDYSGQVGPKRNKKLAALLIYVALQSW